MKITYDDKYNEKPINTYKDRLLGCQTNILDKIDLLLKHTTQKHNKVFCLRMDLRYPKGFRPLKNNMHLVLFMAKFRKHFKRMGYDPYYLWVREQSREKHQHYHLMILVDGNKNQHDYRLLKMAEKFWASTINSYQGGLVDHCNRDRSGRPQTNSYMLNRNAPDFQEVYNSCFHRCSYLAKDNTKGYAPKRQREFGCSRIPN